MNFSEICIKRPVLTIVFSLVLIMIGLMSFKQLSLRNQPKFFRPSIHIDISDPGSSPTFIANNILTPLESQLQQVPNISFMKGLARQDVAQITLQFKGMSQAEFLTAQSEVNQAVGKARLPDSAKNPDIRAGGGNEPPLMFIAVSEKNINQHDFYNYVTNNIKIKLEHVSGVGTVDQYSAENALRVSLIPSKLVQFGLSVTDVVNTIKTIDQDVLVGELVNKDQVMALNLIMKSANIEQFQNIIIKRSVNRIIRLKDVAKVSIGNARVDPMFCKFNGKPAAALNVTAADSANPIEVGKRLRKAIKQLKTTLPPGIKIHVVFDSSKYLQHSVQELFQTIFEAVVFVAIVTFLFLGSLRLTIIPVVTIPVCIIATSAIILILGYSINVMTLLALVIAVGLVVDDAIVVLENAYRHLEKGESPMRAALSSMKEVTFPVIGMTLSIIAVYLPTAFMHGKTAVYFQQFAFTLSGAVLISGFVALTLTPMMCARVMRFGEHNKIEKVVDRIFSSFRHTYQRFLNSVMKMRWLVMLVFILLFGSGYFALKLLPTSLLPKNIVGYVMAIFVGPNSASSQYSQKALTKEIMPILLKQSQINHVLTFGVDNFSNNIMSLNPAYQSAEKTSAFAKNLQPKMSQVLMGNAYVTPMDLNSRHRSGTLGDEFYLQGYVPMPQLVQAAYNFKSALLKTGLFSDVNNGLRYNHQQYYLTINRRMAHQLNVPLSNIKTTLSSLFGGATISDGFNYGSILYDVIIQLPIKDLSDLSILKDIFVPTNTSPIRFINLKRLLNIEMKNTLPQITHINGQPSGTISVTPKVGTPGGKVLSTLGQVAQRTLPAGVSIAYSQKMMDLIKGKSTSFMVFGLGVIFIYLIFAALFESFVDPFIILFTVPLCIVGALFSLYLIGGSLNIYTDIALVTLIGLVSKHGVLITHFANQLRAQGRSVGEAACEAASIRLRPILMTTATMVMGALPLMLASGSGANGRIQVGTIIIAGLLFGTFFSLVIVPVIYTLVAKWRSVPKDVS